jgi:RimK family alpha-L-glutamate ligase
MSSSPRATNVAFCTNIALEDDAQSLRGRNHAIVGSLRSRGFEVQLLWGPEDFLRPGVKARFRAGLLCPNDLYEPTPDPEGRLRAETCALILEEFGVPFVNSPLRRRLASNKLATHALLTANNVPQPDTWTLPEATGLAWPQSGLVVKPVVGSGGKGVSLARTAADALRHAEALAQVCLVQEYIQGARCVRVVATQREAVGRYEKRVPRGTLVAGVSSGASEVRLPPRADLDQLAVSAVAALRLDIGGVDILEDPAGRLLALEVNANFGFFPRSTEILDAIHRCVAAKAWRTRPPPG